LCNVRIVAYPLKPEKFNQKRLTLLGYGAIPDSDATMERITLRYVTNGSTAGNGVFFAVRGNGYVTQEQELWKRCSLWVRAEINN
jgi:hypothetical protein